MAVRQPSTRRLWMGLNIKPIYCHRLKFLCTSVLCDHSVRTCNANTAPYPICSFPLQYAILLLMTNIAVVPSCRLLPGVAFAHFRPLLLPSLPRYMFATFVHVSFCFGKHVAISIPSHVSHLQLHPVWRATNYEGVGFRAAEYIRCRLKVGVAYHAECRPCYAVQISIAGLQEVKSIGLAACFGTVPSDFTIDGFSRHILPFRIASERILCRAGSGAKPSGYRDATV